MELGDQKVPQSSNLKSYWDANKKPLLEYINKATTVISGKVLSKENNGPVKATIRVKGNQVRSPITTNDKGEFHLFLSKGAWDLVFDSQDFLQTTSTVQVGGVGQSMNFFMVPKQSTKSRKTLLDFTITILCIFILVFVGSMFFVIKNGRNMKALPLRKREEEELII